MKRLQGKIVIVTGGASGIGRAICRYAASQGATVVVADIDESGARDTAAVITAGITMSGQSAMAVKTDVADPEQVKSLIDQTLGAYGRIDYLFNNAGIGAVGEFQDIGIEHWKQIMDVNYWGVYYGCRFVYPVMQQQHSGHIVNTASLYGLVPGLLNAPYCASKHAVVGLSLTLRAEAREYGIKVSALCPGGVDTAIFKNTPELTGYLKSPKNKAFSSSMKLPSPEKLVRTIMRRVEKNRVIIALPFAHKILWWLFRMFPTAIPAIWHKAIQSLRKNDEKGEIDG